MSTKQQKSDRILTIEEYVLRFFIMQVGENFESEFEDVDTLYGFTNKLRVHTEAILDTIESDIDKCWFIALLLKAEKSKYLIKDTPSIPACREFLEEKEFSDSDCEEIYDQSLEKSGGKKAYKEYAVKAAKLFEKKSAQTFSKLASSILTRDKKSSPKSADKESDESESGDEPDDDVLAKINSMKRASNANAKRVDADTNLKKGKPKASPVVAKEKPAKDESLSVGDKIAKMQKAADKDAEKNKRKLALGKILSEVDDLDLSELIELNEALGKLILKKYAEQK